MLHITIKVDYSMYLVINIFTFQLQQSGDIFV